MRSQEKEGGGDEKCSGDEGGKVWNGTNGEKKGW